MGVRIIMVVLALLLTACANVNKPKERQILTAPPGTTQGALTALDEGNRLYQERQWEQAKDRYLSAIKIQPTLAEAHYNLAMAYEKLRDKASAYHHYIEAANLAPGNKVIWDAPPLRRHGEVDAHPAWNGPNFIPAMH